MMWMSVKDKMPEFPYDDDREIIWSDSVIGCYVNSLGIKCVKPMRLERKMLRGRKIVRWIDECGRLIHYEVKFWMPLPEPPAEDEE